MGEKAGRWLRVSTSGQSEENQEPDIDRHIDGRGYESVTDYVLHGKSASKGEQESALSQVIGDIESGKITVLVAWTLDRLDRRGIAESFATKLRIEKAGGRVEFALEPTMGELEFAVKAYMASEESKRKAERVRIGQDAARANGAATTTPPWGLRTAGEKRNKRFVLTEQGHEWAPRIYQAVADGMSATQAAREFSGTSGKKWSTGTISALIRNPTYKGTVLDSSGTIVHRCEAAVDAGLWTRANKALSDKGRKQRGRGPKSPLAGVLSCAECGHGRLYRDFGKDRHGNHAAYVYYRCSTPRCLGLPAAAVEAAVDKIAEQAFTVPVKVTKLVPGHNHDTEIEETRYELRHLDLDAADYDEQHAALRARLAELKALPSVPDTWVTEETDHTYADEYAAVPEHERAAWLKRHQFRIWAGKDTVSLVQGGGPWEADWTPVADFLPQAISSGRVAHTVPLG